MRFNSNPRIATLFQQHPTRLPYELQERIRKLPDHLALSKPTLVIAELTDAVKYRSIGIRGSFPDHGHILQSRN